MITLELDNVYLRIVGIDERDEMEIWNRLSFKVEVFGQAEPRYRHLYNRKTKKAYAGLFKYVVEYLDAEGLEYKVVDNRNRVSANANFELVKFVDAEGKIPLTQRPYQATIVDNAQEREIIQAATGAGKTFIMAALIAKFNVKPVCVFADKITLCEQLKAEFEKFLGVSVGLVGGGYDDRQDITVFSLQSATEDDVRDANFILFDECHHIPSDTCRNVASWCTSAFYRIGVSATPWRDAGDDMLIEAVLSKRSPENCINASMLIRLGFLVKPSIYFVPIKSTFKGKNYADMYNKAIVENVDRNKIVTKIAYNMVKNKKHVLVLIKNIKHGELLKEMIAEAIGGEVKSSITVDHPKTGKPTTIRVSNVEFLSGTDNGLRRKAVIAAVKNNQCPVLVASTIADEGLDLPILDTLILAGGGKSSTRAFQRVGRVLRLYAGKTKAIVFDFVDHTPILRRHSRIRRKLYETEDEWDIDTFNVNP